MDGVSLAPHILFYIGSFAVTNAFFWGIILNTIVIITIILMVRSLKKVPGRGQSLLEIIIGGAFDFVISVVGSKKKAQKIFPLVFSMFFIAFIANLVTFIPGQAAVNIKTAGGMVPLFRTIVADYSLVFVMTLISIITAQIVAIKVHGPFSYIGQFINLDGIKNFIKEALKGKLQFSLLAQGFLDLFLGFMNTVGEIAKLISLSFRLFGNMFAAEVLGAVILFLAPFIVPLPFKFLGLLTAIVQPFVFAILTLIFINMASEIEEDEMLEKASI